MLFIQADIKQTPCKPCLSRGFVYLLLPTSASYLHTLCPCPGTRSHIYTLWSWSSHYCKRFTVAPASSQETLAHHHSMETVFHCPSVQVGVNPQSCWGGKGPLLPHLVRPPAQAGSCRAGCQGQYEVRFWIPPRMDTLQRLWAACSFVWPPSQ